MALAAACLLALPAQAADKHPLVARAARACGGYSYAGFQSPTAAYGISGRVMLSSAPTVQGGHVAAWIGVGGTGLGPNATDEWVQVGVAGFPDGRSELYYEYQLPDQPKPTYVALARVSPGVPHDVAVYERPTQQNAWRVMVDGIKVSQPIVLPGSHGAWRPIATSESLDGGAQLCNSLAYDFSNLAVATTYGGGWQPFALARPLLDDGYRLVPRSSGFATSAA